MKNLNIIQLVKRLLDLSNLGFTKEYNEVRNVLKTNYTEDQVFTTMRYIKGEYTESQEEFFLEVFKGI